MSKKKNRLYNYLVNTYGLSKEKVMEHFEARIEEIVARTLIAKWDSNWVEKIMINNMFKIFNGEIKLSARDHWSDKTFQEYFKQRVEELIKEGIEKQYKISVNIERTQDEKK